MNHLASTASAYVDADDNIIEQRNSISNNDIIQVASAPIAAAGSGMGAGSKVNPGLLSRVRPDSSSAGRL